MPTIRENISLKHLNTFGVEAKARWFTEINSENDLRDLWNQGIVKETERFVLGGGSNILLTKDYDGLIIKINIRGIKYSQIGTNVLIQAGAGEVWNDLVNFCVSQNFSGLENLSLIPGSVGASPVQNIGAYGVEIKDVFVSCRAFDMQTGNIVNFTHADCKFGYRDSIFKSECKGRYIITNVTFNLSSIPTLKLTYGAIKQELDNRQISQPTIKQVSEVVASIRVSKLPDPSTIGNAGSFFKNPIIEVCKLRHLQSAFPDIVHYSVSEDLEKIAAGWLIEKIGWKGKRIGDTGTWKNQSLVLVNYGKATGTDIYDISSQIIADVKQHFDIILEREVNLL